jgi:hypothetical protein
MINFSQFLLESISAGSIDKANSIISGYLSKKVGSKMFPTVEEPNGKVGLRYYIPSNNYSFRVNWTSPSSFGTVNVESLDVWYNEKTPYHVKFDKEQSLIKIVPMIAELLNKKPEMGSSVYMDDEGLQESFGNPAEIFSGVVDIMTSGSFSKSKVYQEYKTFGIKILERILEEKPNFFREQGGSKYTWIGTSADAKTLKEMQVKILNNLNAPRVTISRGSGDENYKVPAKVEDLEKNQPRLSYEEQLKDLKNLLKMTLSGAANALFISGRGGVGKTHTVEEILKSMGKRDNVDYFKNAGSATAAGLYSVLYRYKDKIVFFDDSDDALKDQEARNIFKAATDTKAVRKLVWNKMGKNVVDPDEDMTDEEILDAGLIPRYFEFTGKIIFISNLSLDKLDPDGAIRTRAFLVDVNPTDAEVYDFMEKIVDDMPLGEGLTLSSSERKRVVKILRSGTSKQTANFRKLNRGLNMLAGCEASGVSIGDAELQRMISMYA